MQTIRDFPDFLDLTEGNYLPFETVISQAYIFEHALCTWIDTDSGETECACDEKQFKIHLTAAYRCKVFDILRTFQISGIVITFQLKLWSRKHYIVKHKLWASIEKDPFS